MLLDQFRWQADRTAAFRNWGAAFFIWRNFREDCHNRGIINPSKRKASHSFSASYLYGKISQKNQPRNA
jgi:hypothetical protein